MQYDLLSIAKHFQLEAAVQDANPFLYFSKLLFQNNCSYLHKTRQRQLYRIQLWPS